jgi:hypothetical protein
MSRASKPHSTGKPKLVWLPDAFQEVRRRVETSFPNATREAIDRHAEDWIRDAHLQGKLDLVFQRPDGSFGILTPHSGVWEDDPFIGSALWRQMISRDGIVKVPYPVPGSRRRVPHEQPCRVHATRKSLDALLAPDAPDSSARPPSDRELKDFVAAYIKTTEDGGSKRGLGKAATAKDGLPSATRTRLYAEFDLQRTKPLSKGRPRKSANKRAEKCAEK